HPLRRRRPRRSGTVEARRAAEVARNTGRVPWTDVASVAAVSARDGAVPGTGAAATDLRGPLPASDPQPDGPARRHASRVRRRGDRPGPGGAAGGWQLRDAVD